MQSIIQAWRAIVPELHGTTIIGIATALMVAIGYATRQIPFEGACTLMGGALTMIVWPQKTGATVTGQGTVVQAETANVSGPGAQIGGTK